MTTLSGVRTDGCNSEGQNPWGEWSQQNRNRFSEMTDSELHVPSDRKP